MNIKSETRNAKALLVNTACCFTIMLMMGNTALAKTAKIEKNVENVTVVVAPYKFNIDHTCPSSEDIRTSTIDIISHVMTWNKRVPDMFFGKGFKTLGQMAKNTGCEIKNVSYSKFR